MQISSKLYVSEQMLKKQDKVIDKIKSGNPCLGVSDPTVFPAGNPQLIPVGKSLSAPRCTGISPTRTTSGR